MRQIPFHKAQIGEEEIQNVVDAIRSGWLTMGPKTIEFEKQFATYLQTSYALSMNSCTAALHLALKAVGLKAGDEVILPTNTFIATAEVVTYFNAIPVLCDIEESTHNMDVAKLPALITPKTKAIIPVHFSGIPCDMDPILEIAHAHGLFVIEDAAHALPAMYKNRKIGTIGDLTCFSFYATKTLCTGEGGMVTTTNEAFAKHIKINRLHGMSKDAWNRYTAAGSWYYEIVDNGCKYNMTDMNAGLGLAQLKRVEAMWERRCHIARRYTQAFQGTAVQYITCPEDRQSAWHLFVIKVNNRNELIEQLKSDGILCSVHFIPVHLHPYYRTTYGYQAEHYPIANKVFEQSLSLPIYPDLSDADVDYIIERVLVHASK